MIRKAMTAAILGLSLTALPAFAQTTSNPSANPPPANSTNAKPAEPPHQTASSQGLWQASKVVGLDVYNDQNQKIGSIKDLLMNKQGQIETVAIGVGGFLGMGEHDVAVKFSDLKFSDEPVKQPTTAANQPAGAPSTSGAAAPTTTTSTGSSGPKNYPDHAILNATADQLKGMPQFDYNK